MTTSGAASARRRPSPTATTLAARPSPPASRRPAAAPPQGPPRGQPQAPPRGQPRATPRAQDRVGDGADARVGSKAAFRARLGEVEAQQYMLQNLMLGQMNRLLERGPQASALRNFAANIFTGFRQGGAGNCVTVAAIKAGMTRFGTGGIFQRVERANDGSWNVRMRDGYRLNLRQQELDWARNLSRFHGPNKALLDRAVFYYAAAAKRAMHENNDGWGRRSFSAAARTLNDGEMTTEGLHFLGLDRYVQRVSVANMHRYNAVVASNSGHAMWVSAGVVERYGRGQRGRFGINRAWAI